GTVPSTCNGTASVVSILFGPTFSGLTTAQQKDTMATYSIAQFGIEAAIPFSKKPQDCMCYADQACVTPTAACTIGGAGTTIDTILTCNVSGTTMNEGALFLAAFGPHP